MYAIIDIETSGGDPARDRITEIAVYRHDGTQVVDSFVSLVNPQTPIPEFITRITGIDNEMVRDAPKFYEIARRVVEMTADAVFVAHNVRFDYAFIQREFRELGYTYARKQLCTVKLSRKLFPGLESYSLGRICDRLGIRIEARHRAAGDAAATVQLFEQLMGVGAREISGQVLRQEMSEVRLPSHLPRSTVDGLPEETGVYYFHDARGEVLYVGKSTNIRKRVLSHFQGAHKQSRTLQLMEQIHDISYELSGSELIALLRENEEIKRIQPPHNRAQMRRSFKHGIYSAPNEAGYLTLHVGKYDERKHPHAGYSGQGHAEAALDRFGRRHELCPKLYGAESGPGRCFHVYLHLCRGACTGEESPESYNERVILALHELSYGKSSGESYLISGKGRHYGERSVVWVHQGVYRGYAYLDSDLSIRSADELAGLIPRKPEAPDVYRILRQYVHKHPKEVKRLG
ncbi:MAG: exonuclease domain-containing protein [Bacteroidia bacterium]|nr:exonuclease domain-containing protein [Bacteroidia bacterium]